MQREVRAVDFLWIILLISLLTILLITPCTISGRGTDSVCPERVSFGCFNTQDIACYR